MGISRTKNDIPRMFFRTRMHLVLVNVTFYEALNMIHDVIRTANTFHTAKFMLAGVSNDKSEQIRR